MMMPSVFGESLFDDLMDFPFEKEFFGHRNPLYGKHAQNVMKTDIKESDTAYEMDIDLPGFKKEDVSAKLENGYLTITAAKGSTRTKRTIKAFISAVNVTAVNVQEPSMSVKQLPRRISRLNSKTVS